MVVAVAAVVAVVAHQDGVDLGRLQVPLGTVVDRLANSFSAVVAYEVVVVDAGTYCEDVASVAVADVVGDHSVACGTCCQIEDAYVHQASLTGIPDWSPCYPKEGEEADLLKALRSPFVHFQSLTMTTSWWSKSTSCRDWHCWCWMETHLAGNLSSPH